MTTITIILGTIIGLAIIANVYKKYQLYVAKKEVKQLFRELDKISQLIEKEIQFKKAIAELKEREAVTQVLKETKRTYHRTGKYGKKGKKRPGRPVGWRKGVNFSTKKDDGTTTEEVK